VKKDTLSLYKTKTISNYKMTLAQWIYIKPDMMTSQDHTTTFVIIVDVDMRVQYKKDPSIPLAAVVDSFDVLVRDIDLIRLLTFCTIHIPNEFLISFTHSTATMELLTFYSPE
jgi:hypothetical protein